MVTDKVHGLLGLARRAGKIAAGDSAVEANLKKQKVFLLLFTEDASAGVVQKYSHWCGDLGIPTVTYGQKEVIGQAIGLSPRTLVAVLDEGFAKAIHKAVHETTAESGQILRR
ncbi:ribosomal protein, l7ae family [Heliomicrobium modesticaldum Ice1]|uniref:Ribosomal protein, l7ae family n=1 Tax=Heliobacterium modesticaldum (strain ATCC 51547 / Ice1) TaxID=498761 RepID=B0THR2_HELMI|nr:ribosomal L7Ae/L30e/S12e/Gadd45 family protein [Heliomicrobium modesticaldum]ABZ84845.1 ribosomal protein, l7ae family [Heliomicrobium modesticaldum Ice1]